MSSWILSSDPALNEVATRLRAVSHPTRLAILLALQAGELSQKDLNAAFPSCLQSSLSTHISKLRQQGWVETSRRGQLTYARLSSDPSCRLLLHYCLSSAPLSEAL